MPILGCGINISAISTLPQPHRLPCVGNRQNEALCTSIRAQLLFYLGSFACAACLMGYIALAKQSRPPSGRPVQVTIRGWRDAVRHPARHPDSHPDGGRVDAPSTASSMEISVSSTASSRLRTLKLTIAIKRYVIYESAINRQANTPKKTPMAADQKAPNLREDFSAAPRPI